ncbi:hypothetical protein Pyn_28291 [Prunus yedoensis var. nudiflora]|uniref:Uncharacterized protein n=2 Tax=Prunus yedoensis var. nudiflora TaxID=2094558 RepID=A0A314UKN6_PRUYE|nr:hypothetical protein Pyn_28291 [Prunus yedoensis var. nudiflora]
MLVQEGRGEKACTSAHRAVAAAATAPEWCSKNFSGSTKDIASSSSPGKLDMVTASKSQKGGVGKSCTKVVAAPPESYSKNLSGLIKGTALLSDPEKLDVVISSGSQKGLDRTIIQNEDIMQRAASFG